MPRKRRKMTDRERVLRRCPKAFVFCILHEKVWMIASDADGMFDLLIGIGFTASEAWADAARRLRGRK